MDRGVLIYQKRRPDGIEMHGDWGSACLSVMIRETHKDYFEVFGSRAGEKNDHWFQGQNAILSFI